MAEKSGARLRTEALAAGYRSVVVDGVSICVRPGEVCTLIGPNGAGKTTILRTIAAQLAPLAGRVWVDGQELAGISGPELARTMALLTTDHVNAELMTCGDVVAQGRYPHTGRLGLLGEDDKRAIADALSTVGVARLADEPFARVSDGQRQRVLLARAICQEPRLLVMDEPTSYLDIRHKLEFVRLVRRLARERGLAVLMSIHELELARHVSDTVVCVAHGRVDKVGRVDEVFSGGYIRRLYQVDDDVFDQVYPGLDGSQPSPLDAGQPAVRFASDEETSVRAGSARLRRGITTGTCAALATAGATRALLTGAAPEELAMVTPRGIGVEVTPEFVELGDARASCGVRKDAGDDPDVTDGIVVVASVTRGDEGIRIEGGEGVGRVTRPGLDQPVGAAAINHVPRQMIEKQARAVADELGYEGGLDIVISIPGGAQLAERTFNPQLGVVGGLSVLGTSGIEEPMSEQALIDTIELAIKQARAEGACRLVLLPGNYAEDYLAAHMGGLAEFTQLKYSNYLGDALDVAVEQGFEQVLVVGHVGKLVKLAGGVMNTHSRVADCRLELMCAHAAVCGASQELCQGILASATTDAAIQLLKEAGLCDAVMHSLLAAMQRHLDLRCKGALQVGAVVFSNVHGTLGASEGARAIMESSDIHYLGL